MSCSRSSAAAGLDSAHGPGPAAPARRVGLRRARIRRGLRPVPSAASPSARRAAAVSARDGSPGARRRSRERDRVVDSRLGRDRRRGDRDRAQRRDAGLRRGRAHARERSVREHLVIRDGSRGRVGRPRDGGAIAAVDGAATRLSGGRTDSAARRCLLRLQLRRPPDTALGAGGRLRGSVGTKERTAARARPRPSQLAHANRVENCSLRAASFATRASSHFTASSKGTASACSDSLSARGA